MDNFKNKFTVNEVESFWDGVSEIYEKLNTKIGYGHKQRYEEAIKWLEQKWSPKIRILNIWSRMGACIPYIRKVYPQAEIVNMELSGNFLKEARNRYPEEMFLKTDFLNINFEPDSFDYIISLETLEHVPEPLVFLKKLHLVLKNDGRLILSCPPSWAEIFLKIHDALRENHGEGPHRFPSIKGTKNMLKDSGFILLEHKGTVFFPLGPEWLQKNADIFQDFFRLFLNNLGVRQFYVCSK